MRGVDGHDDVPADRTSQIDDTYIENGSRLYLDVGSHPEYIRRSPGSHGCVGADAAGELVMRDLPWTPSTGFQGRAWQACHRACVQEQRRFGRSFLRLP